MLQGQGRSRGMFGSVKRTFRCMKRSSSGHRSARRGEGTAGPKHYYRSAPCLLAHQCVLDGVAVVLGLCFFFCLLDVCLHDDDNPIKAISLESP